MVGPWQTPVADVAVTASALNIGGKLKTGEAMAMGEKPTLALISAAASARMAVAESLMNIGAAHLLDNLPRIRLSAKLDGFSTPTCSELASLLVKDSTSMKASWKDQKTGDSKTVTAPMTVVISAFAPVANVRNTWTPALRRHEDVGETTLMYVDLAQGHKAMGGSALAQSFGQVGDEAPDVRDTDLIVDYFDALQQLHESGVSASPSDVIEALFNEELGAIFQVRKSDEVNFMRCFATCGPPPGLIRKIGRVPAVSKQQLAIRYGQKPILHISRSELQQQWTKTSYQMQRLRDNVDCADVEFENIKDDRDPGLHYTLTYEPKESILPLTASITSAFSKAPRVAILREQGVNGHAEMAFAFKAAGFDPIDVHMTDIISGHYSLANFVGIAACGGFSYGDVLGAGRGWANSILMHEQKARPEV
ncbi:hypothetical protein DID88_004617 [Monilinia fructigena]|uniref:FGAR-AT PurM N-terminal-like domain-containing protein n=1 Tax=Monilinia fructigena TaxID=38457 RepID=A0A395IR20_9HELO|nr:hypothetical protein DID88_004617 [Monilinia fructigena]